MPRLRRLFDRLEAHYGKPAPRSPTDPYDFLIWWHCGYPPGEERCSRGWQALRTAVGTAPAQLLAVRTPRLARVLAAGGMVGALRAKRLKEIAARVRDEFGGDLRAALAALEPAAAHRLLRTFPGIGAPGADRILLFAGLVPVAAVPSANPHVAVRLERGKESARYAATYKEAQQLLEAQVPATCPARTRAYLLLYAHGRALCTRSQPRCLECPVAGECACRISGEIQPRSI